MAYLYGGKKIARMDRLSELRRQVIADPAFENVAALYHYYCRLGEKLTPLQKVLSPNGSSEEAITYISENIDLEIDVVNYQLIDLTGADWIKDRCTIYYCPYEDEDWTLEIFVDSWMGVDQNNRLEFVTKKAFELGLMDYALDMVECRCDETWTVDGYLITNVPHESQLCVFDTKKKIDVDSWHKEFLDKYIEEDQDAQRI